MSKFSIFFMLLLLFQNSLAGKISYEIYNYKDNPEGILVASGTKEYSPLRDIKVKTHIESVYFSKSLELITGFTIGVGVYIEPEIKGFGLWAETTPESFSWEWFQALDNQTFRKYQETGLVTIQYKLSGDLKELVSVTFNTNVSLRISELGSIIDSVEYRIIVKKGSILDLYPNQSFNTEPSKAGSG